MERLDRFMARANDAYYATHDPFADFTTAPEISQMFGELLGAWAITAWKMMGEPVPVVLAEAGPGRGTLMADALRLIGRVGQKFGAALEVWLVERSPRLRAVQAARLPLASFAVDLSGVPAGPCILVANEFLDALPIRQFVRRGDGWRERYVEEGGWREAACDGPAAAAGPAADAREGEVVECNEAALAFVGAVARRLVGTAGYALLVDYGPARSGVGDSLQALQAGQPADPLQDAGSCDLTAHVDFEALAMAARRAGAAVFGPVPQGKLLERLGLFGRAQALAKGRPAAEVLAIMEQARRLAQPERMGALFKALAIGSPWLPAPPGFEA